MSHANEAITRILQALTGSRQNWRILGACVLAVICTAIDPAFLGLTSAEVQAFLREPQSNAPLLVAIEFLILGIIALISGTAGDVIGRRRVLLVGLAGICITNVAGIVTVGTPAYLQVHRLNLVTDAMVVPMSVAIVTLAFDGPQRTFAFGAIFGLRSAALLIGSVMGYWSGVLDVRELAFVPVIVLSLVSIWLVARHVPESAATQAVRGTAAVFNLILLVTAFMIAFFVLLGSAFLLREGAIVAMVVMAFGTVIVLSVTARWWVKRLRYLLSWENFSPRDVAIAILVGMLMAGVQGAFLHEFWTFSREFQGIDWFRASLRIAPYVVGILIGSLIIVQVSQRLGARLALTAGMCLMAISLLCMALLQLDAPYWLLFGPIFLMGLGFGIATPIRAQIILTAPPRELVGASASVNTATGQLGNALGIAAASVVVMRLADNSFLNDLRAMGVGQEMLDATARALPDYLQRAIEPTYAQAPAVLAQVVALDYANAWTDGLGQLFLGFGILMLAGAIVVYLAKSRSAPHALAEASPQSEVQAASNPSLNQSDISA
jgi:DHA2 family multidrug resistance protein-like MFS transporter